MIYREEKAQSQMAEEIWDEKEVFLHLAEYTIDKNDRKRVLLDWPKLIWPNATIGRKL
jgi:hypothetical protein